jgi:hypothetical protein
LGLAFHLLLNVSIAIIAVNEMPDVELGYWLSLALLTLLLVIWGRQCRGYYKLNFSTDTFAFSAVQPFGWKNVLLSSRELTPFALLVLGPFDMVYLILWFFLALALGNFCYVQARILLQLTR